MEITLRAPVTRTPRVQQIESMFDVASAAESVRTWNVNLPLDSKPWHIGLITGPSGSGKSTHREGVVAAGGRPAPVG